MDLSESFDRVWDARLRCIRLAKYSGAAKTSREHAAFLRAQFDLHHARQQLERALIGAGRSQRAQDHSMQVRTTTPANSAMLGLLVAAGRRDMQQPGASEPHGSYDT
jgi:hypothetical protein